MSSLDMFQKLEEFKQPTPSGVSSQTRFLEYCQQTLGAVERYHIEFKEKRDDTTPTLHENDKKNLAKATSGFANSGGGILIWGIENETLKPKPITDIKAFLSKLLDLSNQVTDPVVSGIDGDWIPADSGTDAGYALIHIPESVLPPHRVILNQPGVKNHYYIRSGDSFIVAPHVQLEDMFGRRPKPKLIFNIRLVLGAPNPTWLYIFIGIKNIGRGSAKSPFLAVDVQQPYEISQYGIDGNRGFGLNRIVKGVGSSWEKYGGSTAVVIHPQVAHEITAIRIEVDRGLMYGGVKDLVINYQIAAEGIPLIEDCYEIEASQLWDDALSQYIG